MSYHPFRRSQKGRLIGAMFLVLLLAACGGGGGGGTSTGSGVQPVAYAGNLNNATVTGPNAGTLADAALNGRSVGGSAVVGATVSTEPVSGKPRPIEAANAVRQSLRRANFAPLSPTGVHLNGATTDSCLISGSATVNITVDDATGNLTGDMSFSACSDVSGESTSGTATVTGHVLGANSQNPQIDLLTTNGTLALTDASGTSAFTGTLAMSFTYANTAAGDPSDVAVVANVDTHDDVSGIYLRLANFAITGALTYNNGTLLYEDDTLSGTVCHSVEGCITVQTATAFRFYGTDPWPASGQLTVTGAGNTSARLTAVSNALYTLEWDADGDSNYDPGALVNQPWSTL